MIKNILWDVDGTLLNFKESEKYALSKCLDEVNIPYDDDTISLYSKINLSFWKRLEKGEISRHEVIFGRFEYFFKLLGRSIDIDRFQKNYQTALAGIFFYYDDSLNLCRLLKEKGLRQYIVTNGIASTQHKKLKDSCLDELMDKIFISDEIGTPKPNKNFFDAVFENIPNFSKEETLIVGDSLTSDMRGGNNSGILCCWYNPFGEINSEKDLRIDYEIKHLWELLKILNLE